MDILESNALRVLDILTPHIHAQRQTSSQPVILGITGLQGSGKSTWASKVVSLLSSAFNLRAITISLDDLYKTHDDLIAQREKNPENKLYRTRGHPGTHDEQLAEKFFAELKAWKGEGALRIPSFDKSRFNGEGDRAPNSEWPSVSGKIDVMVFEGWCVGFRPLSESQVEAKYQAAEKSREPAEIKDAIVTLSDHQIAHLLEINRNLKRYCDAFMGPQHFDFMIHIDTVDLHNVYRWRLQQEYAMIKARGSGMTDDAVMAFVRGYMPAYELYLDELRSGMFPKSGRQVRVVLGIEREVEKVELV
ncbi:P-loop containing nucleoside triphosphate hydrolase protein [Amniculicola lignicola CBS 123094]|uniref:P-loop containing nucleoside triphosphate hydrolase protein n=1 Tax=Amniculicola lignicola CBS 123094 TaxID=1392246 RepID=A0A6A5WXI9_9PLEO|nr:P-loop containing nucleoside triphosphate hydrolase protein [Amniculicola lignicola CBS 123094]